MLSFRSFQSVLQLAVSLVRTPAKSPTKPHLSIKSLETALSGKAENLLEAKELSFGVSPVLSKLIQKKNTSIILKSFRNRQEMIDLKKLELLQKNNHFPEKILLNPARFSNYLNFQRGFIKNNIHYLKNSQKDISLPKIYFGSQQHKDLVKIFIIPQLENSYNFRRLFLFLLASGLVFTNTKTANAEVFQYRLKEDKDMVFIQVWREGNCEYLTLGTYENTVTFLMPLGTTGSLSFEINSNRQKSQLSGNVKEYVFYDLSVQKVNSLIGEIKLKGINPVFRELANRLNATVSCTKELLPEALLQYFAISLNVQEKIGDFETADNSRFFEYGIDTTLSNYDGLQRKKWTRYLVDNVAITTIGASIVAAIGGAAGGALGFIIGGPIGAGFGAKAGAGLGGVVGGIGVADDLEKEKRPPILLEDLPYFFNKLLTVESKSENWVDINNPWDEHRYNRYRMQKEIPFFELDVSNAQNVVDRRRAKLELAYAYVFIGNYEKGIELYQEVENEIKYTGEDGAILSIQYNIAMAFLYDSQFDKAISGFKACIESSDPSIKFAAQRALGDAYSLSGKFTEAKEAYAATSQLALQMGHQMSAENYRNSAEEAGRMDLLLKEKSPNPLLIWAIKGGKILLCSSSPLHGGLQLISALEIPGISEASEGILCYMDPVTWVTSAITGQIQQQIFNSVLDELGVDDPNARLIAQTVMGEVAKVAVDSAKSAIDHDSQQKVEEWVSKTANKATDEISKKLPASTVKQISHAKKTVDSSLIKTNALLEKSIAKRTAPIRKEIKTFAEKNISPTVIKNGKKVLNSTTVTLLSSAPAYPSIWLQMQNKNLRHEDRENNIRHTAGDLAEVELSSPRL